MPVNGPDLRMVVFGASILAVDTVSRFEPAMLGGSGFGGAVGMVSFTASVFFTLIVFRRSKGGAMNIAHNLLGATFDAVVAVASAVLASVTASALLPQAGCPSI